MHHAVYNPDRELIALFLSDDDQQEPTQRAAAWQYTREYCSPFCQMVQYPASTPINAIPTVLPE